jgi:hypothetical protein
VENGKNMPANSLGPLLSGDGVGVQAFWFLLGHETKQRNPGFSTALALSSPYPLRRGTKNCLSKKDMEQDKVCDFTEAGGLKKIGFRERAVFLLMKFLHQCSGANGLL